MEAGRELDSKVAERLGWNRIFVDDRGYQWGHSPDEPEWLMSRVKPYSTCIAAAWELVEKLKLAVFPDLEHDRRKWIATTSCEPAISATAPTAPHAIALAFLKATEGNVPAPPNGEGLEERCPHCGEKWVDGHVC